MTFSNKHNFDAGLSDLFTEYWKNQKCFLYKSQGHSIRINGRCVVAALRGYYRTHVQYAIQRRHNTAAVDPVTVALGNVLRLEFFIFSNTL